MSPVEPPRLAELLLRLAADPLRRDAQLGDLLEELQARAARNPAAARRWYRYQALASVAPNLAHRARRARRRMRTNVNRGGDGMMRTLVTDVRLAFRGMRKEPGFYGMIVLTVGLGIAAITTTFSVAHGLVLDPFPFPEPGRIVGVGTAYPRMGVDLRFFENLSPAEFEDIRDNSETLEAVVAWDMGNRQVEGDGPPENVFTAFWWGDVLSTLGMSAHLGRGLSQDEIRTGAAVAVLGYGFWTNRFGADSTLVGKTIRMNGNPLTVVGVAPSGVDLYGTGLWIPMTLQPDAFDRNRRQFQVMARISAGASLDAVNAELAGLAARVEEAHGTEYEEYQGWLMKAETWNDVNSRLYRTGVFTLLGAVAFVLLLVCANTANLLLARAQRRGREMAVRTALGAGRGRLFGQLLTESLMLGALGGLLGIGLAYVGVQGVNGFIGALGLPAAGTVSLSGPVLAFTAAVTVGVGILFGLAPATRGSAGGISLALKSEAAGATPGRSRQRLQRFLVGAEVTLAFVLLAGGGLLLNSFVRVNHVDTGFEPERVLTMRLTLPREKYDGDAVPTFFRNVTQRVEAIPGVIEAGAGSQFPPVAFSFRQVFFDGMEMDPASTLPTMLATAVSRGYFETLGIPLRRGRTFTEADAADAPGVAVLNEAAVSRYFDGKDPIGRRMRIGDADPAEPWWEIVGVVGSTKNLGLDEDPFPEVFAVHDQVGAFQNQLYLLIRSDGDPRSLVSAVREAVLELDADLPVYQIRTVEEAYQQGVAPMRATALFLAVFAAFALILAAVGIYAVVAFTVTERTQEIGLRMALGADRGTVRRLVVRQALIPVLAGAAVGLAAAVALGRSLERLLYQLSGADPLTLAAVALLLVAVATAASWVPAYRATRLDPVRALRSD